MLVNDLIKVLILVNYKIFVEIINLKNLKNA